MTARKRTGSKVHILAQMGVGVLLTAGLGCGEVTVLTDVTGAGGDTATTGGGGETATTGGGSGGSPATTGGGGGTAAEKCPSPTWWKTIGGPGAQELQRAAIDPAGNFVLTGSFDAAGDFGGGPVQGMSWYLVELTPEGDLIWERTVPSVLDGYDDPVLPISVAMDVDPTGNILVAVRLNEWGVLFDLGTGPLKASSLVSSFLVKYGPDGEPLWDYSSPGEPYSLDGMYDGSASFTTIAVDAAGQFLVGGVYRRTKTLGPSMLPMSSTSFFASLGPDGTVLWARPIDQVELVDDGGSRSGYTWPSSIAVGADGQIDLEAAYYGAVGYGLDGPPSTPCTYSYGGSPCQTWAPGSVSVHFLADGTPSWQWAPARRIKRAPDGGYLADATTPVGAHKVIERFDAKDSLLWSADLLPPDGDEHVGPFHHVLDRVVDAQGAVWVVAKAGADIDVAGRPVPAGTFWLKLDSAGSVACVGDFGGSLWSPEIKLAPDGSVVFVGSFTGDMVVDGVPIASPDGEAELLLMRFSQ